jgi:hypothetical protein
VLQIISARGIAPDMLNRPGRNAILHQLREHYSPSIAPDEFAPICSLARLILSFDQNVGANASGNVFRAEIAENHHVIDGFQRRQYLSTVRG